jgi:hypothetical protein
VWFELVTFTHHPGDAVYGQIPDVGVFHGFEEVVYNLIGEIVRNFGGLGVANPEGDPRQLCQRGGILREFALRRPWSMPTKKLIRG